MRNLLSRDIGSFRQIAKQVLANLVVYLEVLLLM